jgi:uncharacterized protein (DUF1501 family)
MNDAELEFEDIQALLSAPLDNSPGGISRRRFLQMTAAGAGVAMVGPTLGHASALAGPRLAHDEGVLVVVQMGGGNDGINTVIPTAQDAAYRSLRGSLAVDQAAMHHLGGGVALHPALGQLKRRWDRGQVAIVQGIGYDNASLSHFDSMAHWMHAKAGSNPEGSPRDGWIGRWLDSLGASRSELEAVVFDSSIPLHFRGRVATAVGLAANGGSDFGVRADDDHLRMYDAMRSMAASASRRGPWADAVADSSVAALDLARLVAPAYTGDDEQGSSFEREMVRAARLINADVGVRVIGTSIGSFDTHAGQDWQHNQSLTEFDNGIERFFSSLDPRYSSRVTVVTFSEFGRRPERNGSGGTDHGTASVAFVIGAKVRGGLVGQYPSLTDLDSRGNLHPNVDFRSVYATILDTWMRASSTAILGGSFAKVDLFRAPPGNTQVLNPAPNPKSSQGYLITTDAGAVHNFGNRASYGGTAGSAAASLQRHPTTDGYWLCTADGGVEPFGTSVFHGSMAGVALASPVVDMAVHPTGNGYWLLGGDGGVFSFGQAPFFGSTGNLRLAQPVVGMAPHPTGRGYWFVASDGGVFAFGSARFFGSTGGMTLRRPIVGMAATPSGRGYWLVADDGGIFAFGDARFFGSTGGMTLARPVVGMAATPSGRGYWLVADDGGIFAFGDAGFQGSLGGQVVAGRVIGITG